MALVKAIYRGPFPAEDHQNRAVNEGDVIEVTPEQLKKCSWFEPVRGGVRAEPEGKD